MSPTLIEAKIVDDGTDRYVVIPVWADVDRPESGGYSCGNNIVLAKRLQKAIEEGPALDQVYIETDVNGKTYVSADLQIRMRCANADLRALGY